MSPPPLIDPEWPSDKTFSFIAKWYLCAVGNARPHQYKHSVQRLRATLLKYEQLVLRAAPSLCEAECSPAVFVYYVHRLREVIKQKNSGGTGSAIVPPQVMFSPLSLEHASKARSYGGMRFERKEQPLNEAHNDLLTRRQMLVYASARVSEERLRQMVEQQLSRERWVHLVNLSRALYAADRANFDSAIERGEWVWAKTSTSATGAKKSWQQPH